MAARRTRCPTTKRGAINSPRLEQSRRATSGFGLAAQGRKVIENQNERPWVAAIGRLLDRQIVDRNERKIPSQRLQLAPSSTKPRRRARFRRTKPGALRILAKHACESVARFACDCVQLAP